MSIKFNLDRIMFEQGKMKVPELHKKCGVNKNTLYGIYNGDIKRIDVSVINRICAALNCQPGELLEYIPDQQHEE